MKKTLIVLSFILTFCYSNSIAQFDFRDGYIIKTANDTVFGKVDYKSNFKSYKICRFKKDGNISKFLPSEIQGYGYINDKYFSSLIKPGKFVEVLIRGEISLYKEENKFYVQKEGGKLYILEKGEIAVEYDNKKRMKEDVRWKGIMNLLINDCNSDIQDLQNWKLTETGLVKIIRSYNQCKGAEFKEYKVGKPWAKLNIGLIAGVAKTSVIVDEYRGPVNYLDKKLTSIDPAIGIVFSILGPRISEKVGFQPEIHFVKSNLSSTVVETVRGRDVYHETYINLTSISVPLSFKYIIPMNPYSINVLAGGILNNNIKSSIRLKSETSINDRVITLNKSDFPTNKFQVGYWAGLETLRYYKTFYGGVTLRYYYYIFPLNDNPDYRLNPEKISLSLIVYKR